ncbi:hypothetical protein SAMN05216276_10442 [Streptosporangium subroseum]|uniref:Uncharacterized protein n=1 Tax=Streptosporangium subroseum TaxID=106412 RepID=A0A239MPI0_9ACTN|nr:hypothetical protein [Streptosporangium subroseum]SNT44656.1 hypothetical protein SAMN05216276_10442 [Streptosporangium subroseum]
MFVLGISWLILTPLCLWNLFRGGTLIRLTSVMVLVSLEAATVWASSSAQPPEPTPVAASPFLAAPAAPAAPATKGIRQAASCPTRLPAPERARLARHHGTLRSMTLFWAARTDECGTATVVLRHGKRAIKVWMHEGDMKRRPTGARTLPVSVADGVASMKVPLAPPLPDTGALRAIDGRSGRPIALR